MLEIAEVLKRHANALMAIPGVVGVAEGEYNGLPCIIVFAASKDPSLLSRIPATLEGYPVRVEESQEFRARRHNG